MKTSRSYWLGKINISTYSEDRYWSFNVYLFGWSINLSFVKSKPDAE